jgi:hypothetical protein
LREQHSFILLLGKDRYGSIGVLSFVFSKRMKFIGQRMLSSNQLYEVKEKKKRERQIQDIQIQVFLQNLAVKKNYHWQLKKPGSNC